MNKALLIIDMQNEFCLKNERDIKSYCDPIIEPINAISSYFRRNGWKIIWVKWGVDSSLSGISECQKQKFNQYDYPQSMSWKRALNGGKKALEKESWSAETVSALTIGDSDIQIDKQRVSGFWFSKLNDVLKSHSIEELYFAGVNTDQCVIATLQDAYCLGYDCFLLEDCTATTSPDFCRQAALYNVKHCFGKTVLASEMILNECYEPDNCQ